MYELQIENEPGFLYAKISGIRNGKTVAKAAKEIIESCKSNSSVRVIIDALDMTGKMSLFDSYMLISKEFSAIKKLASLEKAAVVDHKENIERLKFFEKTSKKFGFNIKTFTELDDAKEWIMT